MIFMNITQSQLNIIKAGLIVFSQLGKSKASMARIANIAKVSKPLLFHHFGSKEKLYKACLQFTNEQLQNLKQSTSSSHSFILMLKEIQIAKFNLETTYPGIFKFALLEQGKIPPIPPTPFTTHDLKRMKKSINPNQFWRMLYYLSLGYQAALDHQEQADGLIQDYQQTFEMIENLVFAKEE